MWQSAFSLVMPIGWGLVAALTPEREGIWLQPLCHTAERDTPCDTSPYAGEILPLGHRGEVSALARDLALTVPLSLCYNTMAIVEDGLSGR